MDLNCLVREYQGLIHATNQVFLSFKPKLSQRDVSFQGQINVNMFEMLCRRSLKPSLSFYSTYHHLKHVTSAISPVLELKRSHHLNFSVAKWTL